MKQKAQQIVVAIGLIISMLLAVAPVFSASEPIQQVGECDAWQSEQNRLGYWPNHSAGSQPALPEWVFVRGEGGRSHA